MIIEVVSAFRNMEGRCEKYFQQVNALRTVLQERDSGWTVRAVACEGDSIDRTPEAVVKAASAFQVSVTLVQHNHGGAWWGSTEAADRLEKLSGVLNAALDGVSQKTDYVLYVESDLLWDPYQIRDLVDLIQVWRSFDIIAPLVYAGPHFYDVWGYRGMDGERFGPYPPYHASLARAAGQEVVVEIQSAGSCLLMTGEVARQVRCHNGGALVGWCEQARAYGFQIGVAPHLRIDHPA